MSLSASEKPKQPESEKEVLQFLDDLSKQYDEVGLSALDSKSANVFLRIQGVGKGAPLSPKIVPKTFGNRIITFFQKLLSFKEFDFKKNADYIYRCFEQASTSPRVLLDDDLCKKLKTCQDRYGALYDHVNTKKNLGKELRPHFSFELMRKDEKEKVKDKLIKNFTALHSDITERFGAGHKLAEIVNGKILELSNIELKNFRVSAFKGYNNSYEELRNAFRELLQESHKREEDEIEEEFAPPVIAAIEAPAAQEIEMDLETDLTENTDAEEGLSDKQLQEFGAKLGVSWPPEDQEEDASSAVRKAPAKEKQSDIAQIDAEAATEAELSDDEFNEISRDLGISFPQEGIDTEDRDHRGGA